MIHANHKLPGFLFLTTVTATLMLVAAAQTASSPEAATQTASFQALGQMPGVWPAAGTYASGISGDGSTIMGYGWVCLNGGSSCSSSDTVLAYRWTVAGGYQILGTRGGSDFFGAGAVSNDGSVVAGEHALPNKFDAFRWTAAHGMVRLPMNIASAITGDGAMVAGGDNWWKTSGQTGIFGPFPGEQDQTAAFRSLRDGAGAGGGGCSDQGFQCIRTGLPCFPVDARRRAAGPGSDHRHGELCDCHLSQWLGDRGGGPGREWLLAGVSLERHHRHAGYRHSRRPGERRIRGQ